MSEIGAFFARWSRIEEAKRDAADDAKALRDEMKYRGLDAKVAISVFRDLVRELRSPDDVREEEALYDLYRSAITGASRAPARDGFSEDEGAA